MGYLIDFLVSAGGSLGAAEVWEHAPSLARRLTHLAVRCLPSEHQERCRKEWLADLHDTPGTLAKLCWVGGCFWAAAVANGRAWQRRRQMARQHREEELERERQELWKEHQELEVRIARMERLRTVFQLVRATKHTRIGISHWPWLFNTKAARWAHNAAGSLHAIQTTPKGQDRA